MIDQKRHIIHVDMDAFFASVEQRDNPELRGKPVAVGGGGKRGVVAAASYEARKFGVRSALPGSTAKRLCPDLIFCKPRFDIYKRDSNTIRAIFRESSELVEPLSLDEAYLDLTHHNFDWEQLAEHAQSIKDRILSQTGLTASAGLSFNKFLAKTASGMNKPDGLTLVKEEDCLQLLSDLPIESFYGIGRVTAARMHKLGIKNGRDLKRYSKVEMAEMFGKSGRYYHDVVRGIDRREVTPHRERKSLSVERTYGDDIRNNEELEAALKTLSEELETRLNRTDKMGRTITLKVRYDNFETFTRQMRTSAAVPDHEVFLKEASRLFSQVPPPHRPIRLLGLGVSNFNEEQDSAQLALGF